jgi:hypothetical protein
VIQGQVSAAYASGTGEYCVAGLICYRVCMALVFGLIGQEREEGIYCDVKGRKFSSLRVFWNSGMRMECQTDHRTIFTAEFGDQLQLLLVPQE